MELCDSNLENQVRGAGLEEEGRGGRADDSEEGGKTESGAARGNGERGERARPESGGDLAAQGLGEGWLDVGPPGL